MIKSYIGIYTGKVPCIQGRVKHIDCLSWFSDLSIQSVKIISV